MNKSHRFLISILLLGAYLLSACSGAVPGGAPRQDDNSQGSQSTEVVFTGNVEAIGASQWTISGQVVGVEGASIDANVKVGDIVKVEATVSPDGSIFALRIEASRPAGVDDNANGNMNGNANDNMNGNANDNMNGNANDNMNGNANDNMNGNANDNMNGNANDNMNGNANEQLESEVYGMVEALSADSVTVNGVAYALASFTEFKTIIAVGDQVKLHVIVGSDGSLVVREIERTTRSGDDNSNSNKNDNDDDKDSNKNSNKNSNDNDDDHDDNDNSNGNSNDND